MPDQDTADPDDDEQSLEQQYEARNRAIQRTIGALAQHDPAALDEYGAKTRIADQHDTTVSRIRYVQDRWSRLVQWRRQQFRGPMHPTVGADAVDDERLRALADGAGDVTVSIELSLVDAYRAQAALPQDLSTSVYIQTLEQARDFAGSVRRVFERTATDGGGADD